MSSVNHHDRWYYSKSRSAAIGGASSPSPRQEKFCQCCHQGFGVSSIQLQFDRLAVVTRQRQGPN
jgi:hypothetical protein